MPAKTDGLGRSVGVALVHDDGHVASWTNGSSEHYERMARLLAELGVTGWQTRQMTAADASVAYLAGLACQVCSMVLPCGCSPTRVLAGQCRHGQARRVHRIAHEVGVCSNDHPSHVGPPI